MHVLFILRSSERKSSNYYIPLFCFIIVVEMEIETIVISAFTTIFSLGLLLVSLASYKRYKNLKLIFASLVFLVFLIKGVILSTSLFYEELSSIISTSVYTGLFDLIILVLLFIATLRR